MKKNLYMLIMIISISLLIFGCNNIETFDTLDNYILFPAPSTILKVNINTGISTPLHTDSFCAHDNPECVFYGVYVIGVMDDTVYFYKREDMVGTEKTSYTLNSYNLSTDKNTILYEHFDILDRIYIAEHFVYFWATYTNYNNEEYVSKEYHLFRYDIQKDKIEPLTKEAVKYLDFGLAYSDGRLFWDSTDDLEGTGVYSTTLEYTDRREEQYIGVYYKDFVYKSVQNTDLQNTVTRSLLRINRKTGDEENICDSIEGFLIIKDKIYYLVNEKNPEFICKSNNTDFYNRYGGKIYSMNLDGTKKTLVCNASEYNFVSFLNFASYSAIAGDYIGIDLYDYTNPNDLDSYSLSSNIFLFNIKNGEYKIAKDPN